MTQFASADFTAANGTELSAADANWSKFRTCNNAQIQSNRLYGTGATPPSYKHSSTPPSADYEVSADFYMAGTGSSLTAGVCARIVDGALTCYWARFRPGTGWQLFRYNSATPTQLGSTYAETISAGVTRRIRLKVEGSDISVYRDAEGSPIITVTDGSPLASAGYVGVLLSNSSTDGPHLDNFSADTLAGDATAPILSSPTGTATGSTTATIGATTDEGNGTLYGYVSTSATPPSGTDLKAGTGAVWSGSASVSSTGAKTLSATGLTASTAYYAHLLHTDAATNDSNIVTSAQFTTSAAGVITIPSVRAFKPAILNH